MREGFEFQNDDGDTVVASFEKVVKMTMEGVGNGSRLIIQFFDPLGRNNVITDGKEAERVLQEYRGWLGMF
jgi:hypothetical protein